MRDLAVCRTLVVLAGLCLTALPSFAGERQIRVFAGATFGGGTTIVDPEGAVGKANLAIGGNAVFLGEVFGADVDIADAPGFFQSGDAHLVLGSRVTTLTGNVVVAAPHRLTEYSLRPYIVGGAGLMRIRTTTSFGVFDVSSVVPAVDIGAGLVGFLTKRVGVSWELRRFQSVGHNPDSNPGLSFGGDVRLSFWRATMAVAIRY